MFKLPTLALIKNIKKLKPYTNENTEEIMTQLDIFEYRKNLESDFFDDKRNNLVRLDQI